MTSYTTSRPIGFSLFEYAPRVFAGLVSWHERRITRNELYRLSDRELEDIGLTRSDIDDVVARLR